MSKPIIDAAFVYKAYPGAEEIAPAPKPGESLKDWFEREIKPAQRFGTLGDSLFYFICVELLEGPDGPEDLEGAYRVIGRALSEVGKVHDAIDDLIRSQA